MVKKFPLHASLLQVREKIAKKISRQLSLFQDAGIHTAFFQLWIKQDDKLVRVDNKGKRTIGDIMPPTSATDSLVVYYKFCYYPALFLNTHSED